MAAPTLTIDAIVLRRTKLGETDMIVTMLAEDGSQYSAVAKGARKPTSTFASRLELYAVATVLLAKGKNLDIIKEARLIDSNAFLRTDILLSSAAAPIVEVLSRSTFQDQPTPRLFACSKSALSTLARNPEDPLVISLAALLKILSFLGFRPTFQQCISCGAAIDLDASASQPFSYFDGGAVCCDCSPHHETTILDTVLLAWCNSLLYATFDQLSTQKMPADLLRRSFAFVNEWIHIHLGFTCKSLSFLFKNILPSE